MIKLSGEGGPCGGSSAHVSGRREGLGWAERWAGPVVPHVKGAGGGAGRRNFTKHQRTATVLKSKS